MTDAQKETLRFYTTNDYLLINGLLWGNDEEQINYFIDIINMDGRGVMAEAREQGYDVRWNCTKEEGEKLYKIYEKRFPVIDSDAVKDQIIARAKEDIDNLMSAMKPLETELVLYRNIYTCFLENVQEGETLDYLGFSSCSLNSHVTNDETYGANDCTLVEIVAPVGTPAIRLDLMPEVQNEPDEVIIAPIKFLVTKVDREHNKMYMTCKV